MFVLTYEIISVPGEEIFVCRKAVDREEKAAVYCVRQVSSRGEIDHDIYVMKYQEIAIPFLVRINSGDICAYSVGHIPSPQADRYISFCHPEFKNATLPKHEFTDIQEYAHRLVLISNGLECLHRFKAIAPISLERVPWNLRGDIKKLAGLFYYINEPHPFFKFTTAEKLLRKTDAERKRAALNTKKQEPLSLQAALAWIEQSQTMGTLTLESLMDIVGEFEHKTEFSDEDNVVIFESTECHALLNSDIFKSAFAKVTTVYENTMLCESERVYHSLVNYVALNIESRNAFLSTRKNIIAERKKRCFSFVSFFFVSMSFIFSTDRWIVENFLSVKEKK